MKVKERLFIVLEGIDGAGKTTCAKILAEKLKGRYYKSGGQFFEKIKGDIEELNNPQIRFSFYLTASICASTEISKILLNKHVICDRYVDSTIIYHKALGADLGYIEPYKLPIILPDFIFYLYAREDVVRQRLKHRNIKTPMDIALEKNRNLQQKIHEEFLKHQTAIKIDTSNMMPEEICSKILETTKQHQ